MSPRRSPFGPRARATLGLSPLLLGVALPLLLGAALSACGERQPAPGREEIAAEEALEPGPGADGGSRLGPGSDSETYPVRLVNPRAYPVIFHASAGAGRVTLDTVAGGDSSLVNVRVAAESLRLQAVDMDGNELWVGTMSLTRPGVDEERRPPLRWVLPASP